MFKQISAQWNGDLCTYSRPLKNSIHFKLNILFMMWDQMFWLHYALIPISWFMN